MRHYLLVLLLLLPLLGGLRAQAPRRDRMSDVPKEPDSLRVWLRRPGFQDSTRVKLLIQSSILRMDNQTDSSLWFSQQAVALARRSGFRWGEAFGLINLAAAQYYTSDYPAAQRSFEAALRVTRQLGQRDLIGHAYLGLGNVATELGNKENAQAYFLRAQQAYSSYNPRFVGGEQLVLHNRANMYLQDRQLALARPLVQQGLALLKRYPRAGRIAKFYIQLGKIQKLEHHPDSAVASWRLAVQLSQAAPDTEAEGAAWLELASLAQEQHQPSTALAHAQRAARLFRDLGDPGTLAEALDVQSQALAALHRPEAYDTLRRYVSLRDSILSQERLEAVATAQARFERTEQQARIRNLEQQRRIQALEADRRAVRSRLQLGGVLGAGGLLGLTLFGAYRRRQRRREAQLRHQLAADLHDDVGSLLSQIAMQTDLLQEGLAPAEQQPRQWAEVAGNSRLAVRQLNDVVWNLDAQNDSVPNLLDRLRDYAHEVLVPTGRDVRFEGSEAAGAAPDLTAQVRRHLYLVYKEALHNILKYAPLDAVVTVRLHRTKGWLSLDVVNTGPPANPGRSSGHGLRNIRERALSLGGTASAGPRPEGGFAVSLRVPVK